MDLSTNYLGLRLPHPLVPGASPLSDDLDTVKQLEDAGAARSFYARFSRSRSPANRKRPIITGTVTTMLSPRP